MEAVRVIIEVSIASAIIALGVSFVAWFNAAKWHKRTKQQERLNDVLAASLAETQRELDDTLTRSRMLEGAKDGR